MDIEDRIRQLREELATLEYQRALGSEIPQTYKPQDEKWVPPDYSMPAGPRTEKPYKNAPMIYSEKTGRPFIQKMPLRPSDQNSLGPNYKTMPYRID